MRYTCDGWRCHVFISHCVIRFEMILFYLVKIVSDLTIVSTCFYSRKLNLCIGVSHAGWVPVRYFSMFFSKARFPWSVFLPR